MFSVRRLAERYPTPFSTDNPPNGGGNEGRLQVRPLRTRLLRAVVAALMILAVTASVASADEGLAPDCVPYDPGLPSVTDQ